MRQGHFSFSILSTVLSVRVVTLVILLLWLDSTQSVCHPLSSPALPTPFISGQPPLTVPKGSSSGLKHQGVVAAILAGPHTASLTCYSGVEPGAVPHDPTSEATASILDINGNGPTGNSSLHYLQTLICI